MEVTAVLCLQQSGAPWLLTYRHPLLLIPPYHFNSTSGHVHAPGQVWCLQLQVNLTYTHYTVCIALALAHTLNLNTPQSTSLGPKPTCNIDDVMWYASLRTHTTVLLLNYWWAWGFLHLSGSTRSNVKAQSTSTPQNAIKRTFTTTILALYLSLSELKQHTCRINSDD